MCVIQRGLLSKTEGANMTSEAGHHGGGSQLYSNQGSIKIKAARENVLSRLRALFQVLSSICYRWQLPILCTMAFMITHAYGEEQTGICKQMDPAIIWDVSLIVNFEAIGLYPCSSTEQLPMQRMNVCIPHVHLKKENHSPDPLGPPIPSRANVKYCCNSFYIEVVVMVLAIIGGIGLAARMLYKRRRAFTEADINMGLIREPAVPRLNDPTFEIHPSIA